MKHYRLITSKWVAMIQETLLKVNIDKQKSEKKKNKK